MSDDTIRVHKACLNAVTAPARTVLFAFLEQAQTASERLPDDQAITLTISMDVGALRRLRDHLTGNCKQGPVE